MITKPTVFGLLGKPSTPKPEPTREEFLRRLALCEARLTLLESNHAEDHLMTSQHRRALMGLFSGLQEALTEAPYKFSEEEQKKWDEAAKALKGPICK